MQTRSLWVYDEKSAEVLQAFFEGGWVFVSAVSAGNRVFVVITKEGGKND